MTDEQVYVVPRTVVMPTDGWHGLRTDAVRELVDGIGRAGRFEPRDAMERDAAFKQVIPYLVLRDGERWFLMHRTKAGRDERLHDRWSIG
ncbi:MAG TPA: hypothetical protein VKA85_03770, partial [Candidatus Limnocylindrales bacterium]|nr:hypothetical protein [Candidatus Limnocylindrales bacterium]